MDNRKTSEKIIYEIIMFLLIFALMTSIIFTFDRLAFEKPINDCYNSFVKDNRNETCTYDETEINNCLNNNNQIIYNNDCTITCDNCYNNYSTTLQKYNDKVNLIRIVLALIISLSLAFITMKDKIIRFALLSSALISLFIATLMAMNIIGRLLPIVILIEFLLVLFIYKKTK